MRKGGENMIVRNANMIFNKNGQGFVTTKITIPVTWAKALKFSKENKLGHIILDVKNERIIIKKGGINMVKIKNKNFKRVGHWVDFELENGVLLYGEDWNGEVYRTGFDEKNGKDNNYNYRPIYKFEQENLDITKIEENSNEWDEAFEIMGFEEI